MVSWSKKSWAILSLINIASIITGANAAVLPHQQATVSRRGLSGLGYNLGTLIWQIIDYLGKSNSYVSVPMIV